MKLPRRKFLHLAAGAAALPAVSRVAWAQSYPSRPVRIIVTFPRAARNRHRRTPDRSMAVGAAGTAGHRRQSDGCWREYRHRTRSCRAPPDGYTLLMALSSNAINASVYDNLPFQFHPRHCTGGEHCQYPPQYGGESIGSGQDGSRVHRLCQGQPRQDQHGVGWERKSAPVSPANYSR